MTPYSQDLRERILETVQRGEGSLRQIAQRFLVSLSFVVRLLQTYRRTGSIQPRPHRGGNPAKLAPEDLERLRELVQQQPDATLEELRQRLGVACSTMAICRALKKMGLPLKKKVPRAAEQGRPDVQERRQEFCAELAGVDPHRLVFVDECGANTAMVCQVTNHRIPISDRRFSGNEPGSSGSPTVERHGGPQPAGEAGAGDVSKPNAPQDQRGMVKATLLQVQA